jgi:hypothetical protein
VRTQSEAQGKLSRAGQRTCQLAHKHAFRQRPLLGYLLACPRTGAWRGSVQVRPGGHVGAAGNKQPLDTREAR